jgi:hypothetical protein
VPVIVTGYCPGAAEEVAWNATFELIWEPVMTAGLKVAVTPAGRPEADKATVPVKPYNR